jgi:hypothetical protein
VRAHCLAQDDALLTPRSGSSDGQGRATRFEEPALGGVAGEIDGGVVGARGLTVATEATEQSARVAWKGW